MTKGIRQGMNEKKNEKERKKKVAGGHDIGEVSSARTRTYCVEQPLSENNHPNANQRYSNATKPINTKNHHCLKVKGQKSKVD